MILSDFQKKAITKAIGALNGCNNRIDDHLLHLDKDDDKDIKSDLLITRDENVDAISVLDNMLISDGNTRKRG
jgi:hypothetical protein